MDSVEILIIHLNGEEIIVNCLESIFKDNLKSKVRVLFNKTEDNSIKLVKNKFPKVKYYVSEKRIGFAEASNFLAKKSKSRYIIFLNNDVVVSKNWTSELLKTIKRNKNCVAVQSKIKSFYNKSYFEYAGAGGGFIDKYGYPFCRGRIFESIEKDIGQYNDEIRVFWACGVSLLVNREYFIKSGMFDESFFMYAEELDFCWRANNSGKEIWYSPKSIIFHIGSFSVKREKINFKKEYLISRNHLISLIKHNTLFELWFLLPIRVFLEIISSIRFPLKRGLPFFASLPSIIYYSIFKRKNNLIKKNNGSGYNHLVYPRSIALDHFINNKKTFKSLNFA